MNWDKYRREDGSIDLIAAYEDRPNAQTYNAIVSNRAHSYLSSVEYLQRIQSRQAAAQALVTAEWLALSGANQ